MTQKSQNPFLQVANNTEHTTNYLANEFKESIVNKLYLSLIKADNHTESTCNHIDTLNNAPLSEWTKIQKESQNLHNETGRLIKLITESSQENLGSFENLDSALERLVKNFTTNTPAQPPINQHKV